MALNSRIEKELREAVKHFWTTRKSQATKQGTKTGLQDAGARAAVTGGRQMDGFIDLVRSLLCRNGFEEARIFCRRRIEIPGWYRPEKQWDLLIVSGGQLIAGIEFQSHVGSFGNNYNNRTEEAIGSATDIWAAYREGAFKPSMRPWLGYMMLLEEAPGSLRPVKAKQPHFKVFPEFQDASYCKRYEILLTKLVRERLYDSACFLLSSLKQGRSGKYKEPSTELTFEKFITSLLAHVIAKKKVSE